MLLRSQPPVQATYSFFPFAHDTHPHTAHAFTRTRTNRHTLTTANSMSSFADPEDLEPADVMEEEVQQEEEDDGVPRSVLQESIKRKGVNSYYYAHSRQNHAPDWDGHEAPRLMSKQALVAGAGTEPESIRSYAWSDEKDKIKVYVTMEGADALDDEAIMLEWNELSLILTVQFPENKTHLFLVKRLYDEIDDASFRVKKDKITLSLKKKEGKTGAWFDLKKEF